jgi:hypothetical protein
VEPTEHLCPSTTSCTLPAGSGAPPGSPLNLTRFEKVIPFT